MDDAERHAISRQRRVTRCDPAPGFAPGIGRYVAQMAETRAALLEPVAGLTPEQLSWHPNPLTESIGTQLLHVAAVEWSWVFEEIFRRSGEEYDGWDEAMPIRRGLPQVGGRPLSYFTDRLERVRAEALAALAGLSDADLPLLVADASPPVGAEPELFSIDWVLFHLVHHEAHHAGQVELLVRLLPAGGEAWRGERGPHPPAPSPLRGRGGAGAAFRDVIVRSRDQRSSVDRCDASAASSAA